MFAYQPCLLEVGILTLPRTVISNDGHFWHLKGINKVLILHIMQKVEIGNVIAMIEKPIKGGRITGLKQWEGKYAIVVIVNKD